MIMLDPETSPTTGRQVQDDGILELGLGTWTWNLELGIWNLEFGIW